MSKSEFDVNRFCERLKRLGVEDPAYALWALSRLVLEVISRQSSVGRVFSSRQLDQTAIQIGARLTEDIQPPLKRKDHIVYLLSQVGQFGGHGRVLADLIAAEQASHKTLLLSHVLPSMSSEYDAFIRAGINVEVAPSGDLAQKVRWCSQRLASLAPRKCYMMLHQFDSVLIAAALPKFTHELIFVHNCDHSLSLGVHLPHAKHADFHRKGWLRCSSERQQNSGFVIPLTATDAGPRNKHFMKGERVKTCASGGFEKFTNKHYIESRDYLYQYPEMVGVILQATGGPHLHVGPLPDEMLQEIKQQLELLKLPPDRFVHIPNVPSIWELLVKESVDVYLGSIPYGGGRATVEAMGAGVPLLIHSNYRSEFLSVEFEIYREAMIWRTFGELLTHLTSLTSQKLSRHSAASRAYYQKYHAAKQLRKALTAIGHNRPKVAPAQFRVTTDLLQDFMDKGLGNAPFSDETEAILKLGTNTSED